MPPHTRLIISILAVVSIVSVVAEIRSRFLPAPILPVFICLISLPSRIRPLADLEQQLLNGPVLK